MSCTAVVLARPERKRILRELLVRGLRVWIPTRHRHMCNAIYMLNLWEKFGPC